MVKFRRSRPLAVTIFGVVAMAIFIACGGGGTTESAKSRVPNIASGPASPLVALEELTKAIESQADEQKTGTASAIASLIQAAKIQATESQAAPLAEAIAKVVAPVMEEAARAALSEAQELAESVATALEANEPLTEAWLEGDEALTKDLMDAAATVMSDALSSDAASLEDLAKDLNELLEDSSVQAMLPERLPKTLIEGGVEASAEQESVPSVATTFDQFGFTLAMDLGSEVRTAQGSASEQGAINFPLGEVNSILTWVPQEGSSPLALVSGTYEILKANQTSVSFSTINDGELSVNGQAGVYLGFKSTGDNGASLGGGLIGSWACAGEGTAYTLTLTGADASTLQIRFDRVLENFSCAA